MTKAYIFSGLGVDSRVFQNIDFGALDIEHISWTPPQKGEDIKSYAKRISKNIKQENPIIIGLSFGGMLAVEISKFLPVKKLILISSAKTKNELPKSFKILGKLRINKLIPKSHPLPPALITNWFFGVEDKSEKELLKTILKETDPEFSIWAVNEIANWKNEHIPESYVHIHGDMDRVIPIKNVKTDFIIKNGGHFMIINKSKEISVIIKDIISQNT